MSTRRSLFTCGALLSAVLLFAPGLVLAQADEPDPPTPAEELPAPPMLVATNVTGEDFDEVKVTWSMAAYNDNAGPLTAFEVYYGTRAFTTAQNSMGSVSVDDLKMTATLDGLEPATTYFVHVAAVNAEGTGPFDSESFSAKTDPAPKPERVTGVMVMPGDEMLTVTWSEPYSGHSRVEVDDYMVQYRMSRTRSEDAGDWMDVDEDDVDVDMMETVIMDLENGMLYDVQVKAMNDVGGTSTDWSRQTDDTGGTPMADGDDGDGDTEAPALPLVGLGFLGTLVAGRGAWLRRRNA